MRATKMLKGLVPTLRPISANLTVDSPRSQREGGFKLNVLNIRLNPPFSKADFSGPSAI